MTGPKYAWVKENADSPWKIRGGLYRSDGPREDDLFEALRTMTSGWCKFLDAVYNHFTERFVEAGFLPADRVKNIPTMLLRGGKLGVPSHKWVYPSIAVEK